jgi:hypothetical protein
MNIIIKLYLKNFTKGIKFQKKKLFIYLFILFIKIIIRRLNYATTIKLTI